MANGTLVQAWPEPLGQLLAALSCLLGCSVLYDLSPDQCASNRECATQFGAGYVCSAGVCEASKVRTPTETTATSDDAGPGGQSDDCSTHLECIERLGDVKPHACIEGKCVALLTEQCPLILPMRNEQWLENLTSSDAVILGGYSPIPPQNRISHFTRFYDLALDEFTQEVGGLPGSAGGRRQVVMVVCEGGAPDRVDLGKSAEHLVNELHVPGVVSTLQSDDLQYFIEEYGLRGETFVLSGLDADDYLLSLQDGGLVWTMLTGAPHLAEPLAPLTKRIERFLEGQESWVSGEELRVALVAPIASPRLLAEIGSELRQTVSFNGRSANDNFPGNFRVININTIYEDKDAELDQSVVVGELLDFRPHVIFAMAADEFLVGVVHPLEQRWGQGTVQPPPFYVLSPYHLNSGRIKDAVLANDDFSRRAVGLGYAAAADPSVYQDYMIRLESTYPEIRTDPTRIGKENFYDAPYFLLFAAAAAGNPPKLTGSLLAKGMVRLTKGQAYRLERRYLREAMSMLQADARNTILLQGTLGPALFDLGTGARADSGSIFCVDGLGRFVPDVIRWDAENMTLLDASPAIQSCIPGF